MNRFNLLKSIPLIIFASLFFSLILGMAIIWPRFQELGKIQASVQYASKELQYQEQYFAQLAETQEKLKDYEKGIAVIDSALPEDVSLPSLLNFIQKAGSQSGLGLKNISPFTVSDSPRNPELKQTHLSIEMIGDYSSFKEFLSVIEKSSRLIGVENISFSSPKEGNIFNFNLRIKVHSY